MALGSLAWLIGLRLPGMALAYEIGERIICAVKLSYGCRSDPQLAGAYGELASEVRDDAPRIIYERGMTALPVDFRSCRRQLAQLQALSGGDLLPGRIFLCWPAGPGCRRSERASRPRRSTSACRSLRPPEVIVMAPDQIETISDATELLVDQQDVTPLGLAYQAIELQTSEDALDVALRRVLRAMKV